MTTNTMNATQKARYEAMVKKGVSPKMAEMLALQRPPGFDMKYSPMHPRKNRGRG